MSTAVIVQARMASTRLPGKVLETLRGETVLAHVLERCHAIAGADAVCCATLAGSEGDPVAAEAARCGAAVFRGSESDVLERYHGAAACLDAEVVLRVTSDCPLIDPEICAQVLRLRQAEQADYACNNMPPSWPHGLDCEAFTFEWLERSVREASKPSEREHVTPYMRSHPEARKSNLAGPGGEAASYRWTLDYQDDLEFMRAMFARLPAGPSGWSYLVPLAIIAAEPELAAINRGHDRDEGLKRSQVADAAEGPP